MRFFLLLAALLLGAVTQAQAFTPDLAGLERVPLLRTSDAALGKALAGIEHGKGRPLQFAVGVPLTLTIPQGQWRRIDSAAWSWRARIVSAGAHSLNLEFARAAIPPGGALWLYAPDGSTVQGPYDASMLDAQGRLWTALLPSAEAVIEVRVPARLWRGLALELAQVHHGFRPFAAGFPATRQAKGIGDAGACNNDVACPEGAGWGNEVRAEVLLQSSGSDLCSGTMINNSAQNNRPLMITARHCGITAINVASLFAYFNFQRSGCNSGSNGDYSDNLRGRSHLVSNVDADTTLVELDAGAGSLAAFGAFLAGWNASTSDIPQRGAGIHHPQGDHKKITLYSTPLSKVNDRLIETFVVDAWRVVWSDGTTEPGSSGSAIHDQNRLLVGVLSGGGASCSTPSEPDYYGRLEVAYGALQPFLAPGNTTLRSLGGRDVATGSTAGGTTTGSGGGGGGGGGGGVLGGLPVLCMLLLFLLRREHGID